MNRASWLVLLVCGHLILNGCVQIYINEERFHAPNIVRGFTPTDKEKLAAYNAAVLNNPLPNRLGGRYDDTSEVPHPGRLYDPDVQPLRNPAPGGGSDQARLSFAMEWQFNRFYERNETPGKDDLPSTSTPPRLCVAMSGGGIRSASFNIGVLSALYDKKFLNKVDVLSAVSGGAYALSWYYAQHQIDAARPKPWGKDAVDNTLFDRGGEYQRALQENGSLFTPTSYYAIGAANLAFSPANLLFNGVFGWHVNTTPGQVIYEHKLQQVFHTPDAISPPSPIYFPDLKSTITERRLPYFVINTTAFIEDSSDHFGAPLYNSIYEFTPIFFGSDSLGRYKYNQEHPEYPVPFARAVAISGAALDGTKLIVGSSQRTLWSLLNQDLGYYIDNPALSEEQRIGHRFLPFPFYYLHHYPRNLEGTHIYLSDGGHAENLGAYALVRRMCRNIIVVDAEHDPTYQFEAYYNLKRALRRDMGVDLYVPEIEHIAQHEKSLREIRADAFVREHPQEQLGKADLDKQQKTRDAQKLPYLQTMDILSSWRWKEVAKKRSMQGCIAHLPYPGRDSTILSVTYIKLAYAQSEDECSPVDEYWRLCEDAHLSDDDCWRNLERLGRFQECHLYEPTEGRDDLSPTCKSLRYAHSKNLAVPRLDDRSAIQDYSRIQFCRTRETAELRKSPYTKLPHFPQDPTTDQDFSQWKFKAYLNLGFDIAEAAMANFKLDAKECPGTVQPH